jgi:hypothetical protein
MEGPEVKWLVPGQLCCVDGFLDPVEFAAVEAKLDTERYKPVDIGSEFDIWHMNHPLNPVVGTTMLWPHRAEYKEMLDEIGAFSVYPMGSAYDYVLNKINEHIIGSQIIRDAEDEVAGIIATVYCYKPGSRLIWHRDDQAYLAAFVVYLSEWANNAGGYFAYQERGEESVGVGHIVEPRKNRLLLFKFDLSHSVTACSTDSASNRISITGFVVRRSKVEQLFETYLRDIERIAH